MHLQPIYSNIKFLLHYSTIISLLFMIQAVKMFELFCIEWFPPAKVVQISEPPALPGAVKSGKLNISYEDQRFDLTKFYRAQHKQRLSKYKISFKQNILQDGNFSNLENNFLKRFLPPSLKTPDKCSIEVCKFLMRARQTTKAFKEKFLLNYLF